MAHTVIPNNNPYVSSSRFADLLYERFGNSEDEFGEDGFQMAFQGSSSPNQARHYVGGFFAGERGATFGSATLGNMVADAREYTIIPLPIPISFLLVNADPADTNLKTVSARHGGQLADGDVKPFQIADMIRKDVCR